MVATCCLAAIVRGLARGLGRRVPQHRFHDGQGTSLGSGRKRGAEAQAIGRSRGGRTTKIHAVCDAIGRAIAIEVTPGQLGDVRAAAQLLGQLPPSRRCAADTAYDSNALRQFLRERGTLPIIPNNPTRKCLHPFDRKAYKRRNLIERAFCRLKDWRRIATRYDKLARNFHAAVAIAAIIIWWA
jgi:transposase